MLPFISSKVSGPIPLTFKQGDGSGATGSLATQLGVAGEPVAPEPSPCYEGSDVFAPVAIHHSRHSRDSHASARVRTRKRPNETLGI
jgi:hypothetical protein